jgi:hypothetical protein
MQSDHRAYRQSMEHLTALHDEWMHSSTGTDSTTSQGIFEILPFESLQHIRNSNDVTIPPIHSNTSFSPSDTHHFYTTVNTRKRGDSPQTNGGIFTPNTSQGKPCSECKTPAEVAHCIKYGTCISYQHNPGNGNGKPKGGSKGGGSKGRGGGFVRSSGGGTKAQGASSLGGVPKLGNVPYSPQAAGGTSPTIVILVIGGGVLAVYFLWHKLRKSKSEDKEMDKKGD